MKKHLFSILAVAGLAVAMASCGKSEDPAKALIDTNAVATEVVGYIYYSPDQTGTPVAMKALPAADVKAKVFVDYGTGRREINANFKYESAEGANAGKFTVKVQVPQASTAATVEIAFEPVWGKQKQTASDTKNGFYEAALISAPVSINGTVTVLGETEFVFFERGNDIEL